MYDIRMLDAARRELQRLDATIARRIVSRLRRLAEHFDDIRPEPLTGDLAGLFKLRVGDYRVVYEVLHEGGLLVVHQVGHRRDIYRGH